MRSIGRVGGLWRYPVKSLAGEALSTADLDGTGIVGDRRWALKSAISDELVTCKFLPKLLTIGADFLEPPASGLDVAHVLITLPDGRTVTTRDPSVESAISAIAGHPLTLWPLRPAGNFDHYRRRGILAPDSMRRSLGLKADDPPPDYSGYEPQLMEEYQYFTMPRGTYKDAYPLHFITSASLETVRAFMPGIDADPLRFRPNLLIDTDEESGLPEFDWKGFDLVIGDVVLNCGEKTGRCLMPSQPQKDLAAEPRISSVFRRLTGFNLGAFGFVRKTGTIAVGDEVFLEARPSLPAMQMSLPPLPKGIPDRIAADAPTVTDPFTRARVVFKRPEVPGVITLGLKTQGFRGRAFLPGQHLVFRLALPDRDKPLIRNYSLSGSEAGTLDADEDYSVTVKRIGAASAYLHDEVQVGDEVEIKWPAGRFFVMPESHSPLVLISNGIGITPLFSMLEAVARRNPTREIFWVHATRNSTTHVFRDRIRLLAQRMTSFRELTIYREPETRDSPGLDYQSSERLGSADLRPVTNMPGCEVFVCGSHEFTRDVIKLLNALDVEDHRIHVELFALQQGRTSEQAGPRQVFPVRFERSGLDAEWVSGQGSLLELAEDLGIPAESDCRFGACQACSARLLSGSVAYDDDDIVAEDGQILLCCANPVSGLVIDI